VLVYPVNLNEPEPGIGASLRCLGAEKGERVAVCDGVVAVGQEGNMVHCGLRLDCESWDLDNEPIEEAGCCRCCCSCCSTWLPYTLGEDCVYGKMLSLTDWLTRSLGSMVLTFGSMVVDIYRKKERQSV